MATAKRMYLVCLRCKKPYNYSMSTFEEMEYTKYSYCEECLRKGLKALNNTQSQIRLTNREWIDFLTEQFNISRTSAKEMLHVMMSVKKEDNFKKQFSGTKVGDIDESSD